MRRLAVLALLVAPVAYADVPHDLAAERTALLGDHVALRLAEGALVDDPTRAHLDWGDERLTIVARDLGIVRASELRDHIAAQMRHDGDAIASLVRIDIARPAVAYGAAIRAPRVRDGARLVYAAFAANREGRVSELAFYVEGTDDLDAWEKLAARIATTITVPHPLALVPLRGSANACRIYPASDPDPYPAGSPVEPPQRGKVFGHPVVWTRWSDASGSYAEALVPEQGRMLCHEPVAEWLDDMLGQIR